MISLLPTIIIKVRCRRKNNRKEEEKKVVDLEFYGQNSFCFITSRIYMRDFYINFNLSRHFSKTKFLYLFL